MKKLYTLGLALIFSLIFTIYAFADVAGMGILVAASIIVPILIIAVVIIAIALLIKGIRRSRNK